jgi:hypothetical protein
VQINYPSLFLVLWYFYQSPRLIDCDVLILHPHIVILAMEVDAVPHFSFVTLLIIYYILSMSQQLLLYVHVLAILIDISHYPDIFALDNS